MKPAVKRPHSICQEARDESGYSLVEVLVAILILSVAILPMVGMFDAGLRAALVGSNYDKGRALANKELEEVKALSYPAAVQAYKPTNANPAGAANQNCDEDLTDAFGCSVTTTFVNASLSPDPNSKIGMQVQVTVNWDSNSNSYTTTGFVAAGTP